MLPEKWFVVRTKENHKELNKWENSRSGGDGAFMEDWAAMFSDRYYSSDIDKTEGYSEISWEEFESYVLGTKTITFNPEIY